MLRVGFVTGSDREHDVDGVCPPSASPISWRALCSTPEGRETDLHQPSGPGPGFAAEGHRSGVHQPARLETQPCPSEDVLPNSCVRPARGQPRRTSSMMRSSAGVYGLRARMIVSSARHRRLGAVHDRVRDGNRRADGSFRRHANEVPTEASAAIGYETSSFRGVAQRRRCRGREARLAPTTRLDRPDPLARGRPISTGTTSRGLVAIEILAS